MKDLGREPDFYELISQWLPLWEAARVPYISCEEIGRAPADQWLAGVEGVWSPLVTAAMKAALAVGEGAMCRWDHCSGDWLKYLMDGGDPESPFCGRYPKELSDERFSDLTEEFAHRHGPQADLVLWRRPWVKGQIVAGYPVEFRAFVLDGQVQGVSSYYPQRRLPEARMADAQRAWALTERLFCTGGPRDFTCDWLVQEDGRLIIIECGPPHLPDKSWADPCCFPSGDIGGIALWALPGSEAEKRNKWRAEREEIMAAARAAGLLEEEVGAGAPAAHVAD